MSPWLMVLWQTATATSNGTDALPLLSVGAFVAILNAAVTFGIVKGKTDGMEEFKREVRDSFVSVNSRIDTVNSELGDIQRALGRLEGPRKRRDSTDE